MPYPLLVALLGGFATAVESAALAALCALVVQTVVHRDLSPLRDLPRVLAECGCWSAACR